MTQHEQEIVQAVKAKAEAIKEGHGYWGDNIITEMKVAVGFEMNEEEFEFLTKYVRQVREQGHT